MPLELNGQPYSITDENILRKYSREFVFTVARPYIKLNTDPEMRQVETAPVHIPTSYQMFKMENGLRKNLGILRYYDAMVLNTENGRTSNIYTPAYISIGHSGVLKSDNPDLNFFVDNCPWNEKVKSDSLHPNFISDAPPMVNTYSATERAETQLSKQKIVAKLTALILDEDQYPLERLRSLANSVKEQATARKMAHKLFDVDRMADSPLRAELGRLISTYPNSMDEITRMDSTDIMEEVVALENLKVLEFSDSTLEWYFHEGNRNKRSILMVPSNIDPKHALVQHLMHNDTNRKLYREMTGRKKQLLANTKTKEKAI